MSPSDYAAVQNAFTRMVVPLRREFGLTLDVPRMRSDMAYAQFIVTHALNSRETLLQDSARLVQGWLCAALARREEAPTREPSPASHRPSLFAPLSARWIG